MLKWTKNHVFLTQNDVFWHKNDENVFENGYWKCLIYWWNDQKVICFNNAKIGWKKSKKRHFHTFSCNFPICMLMKSEIISIFYMQITTKNHVKKHVKNGKSHNFQNAPKSSKMLQIMFWIAEKIAIECLNPNPKIEKIHNANVWEDEFFVSWVCFLPFLKKWKNTFLLVTFSKWALWTWKYAQKKTCN